VVTVCAVTGKTAAAKPARADDVMEARRSTP
jgi:hypothetical protein